jgi:hypothetical protein
MKPLIFSSLALAIVMPLCALLAGQWPTHIRQEDDSDWWSSYYSAPGSEENDNEKNKNAGIQEREIAPSNFQVLGITLDEAMFSHAAAKLGEATDIKRGDASTGRDQVCYVSALDSEKIYLIFERGEVDFNFYLFTGGPSWHGIDFCVPSNMVSRSTSTSSGLHLGITPAQAIAILGRPTSRSANELSYTLHKRKKLLPEDLKTLRQQHPELTDREFAEEYGEYDLGVGADLKFVNSRLTYLTIGKSETN